MVTNTGAGRLPSALQLGGGGGGGLAEPDEPDDLLEDELLVPLSALPYGRVELRSALLKLEPERSDAPTKGWPLESVPAGVTLAASVAAASAWEAGEVAAAPHARPREWWRAGVTVAAAVAAAWVGEAGEVAAASLARPPKWSGDMNNRTPAHA